jgi:hypothetical protein
VDAALGSPPRSGELHIILIVKVGGTQQNQKSGGDKKNIKARSKVAAIPDKVLPLRTYNFTEFISPII